MRLVAKLLENTRGWRSVQAELYLHGLLTRPEILLKTGRLIGLSQSPVDRGGRVLADLHTYAPDDVDEDRLAIWLRDVREGLAREPGKKIGQDDLITVFNERGEGSIVPEEREAVLEQLLDATAARLRRRKQWTRLRVDRLSLLGFRGVDELAVQLSSNQTTVLVGANGSGKTTLLDAAALLLTRVEGGIHHSSRRDRALTDDDIMNDRHVVHLAISAVIGDDDVQWWFAKERGSEAQPTEEPANGPSLVEKVAQIREKIERGDVCLPVVVYYSVNRAVLDIPLRIRTPHTFEPAEAYDGALTKGWSNFRLFFEWFRNREDLENETRIHDSEHRDQQLEAVRRAVAALIPGFSGLRVQRAPLRMLVEKGEWTLYVEQLSDGEKCLLALAGDLARRLAMANPFADDPLLGGGVVLIDEIEQHLYPAWQRSVIPALEKSFPNCQFIVTTHSPAVLGHVDHESIFILKAEREGVRAVRPDISKGMDVNRILEDLLDVPARPLEFRDKIDQLCRLIDAGDTVGGRALFTELLSTLGPTDPALVRAEVLLLRREAARQ